MRSERLRRRFTQERREARPEIRFRHIDVQFSQGSCLVVHRLSPFASAETSAATRARKVHNLDLGTLATLPLLPRNGPGGRQALPEFSQWLLLPVAFEAL